MAHKAAKENRTKLLLDEKDIPRRWYNIQADLKTPAPAVLHPGTGKPIGPQDLAPLFPMALIQQEVSRERWIAIPDEIRDVYRLWRPSPLYRARRLERVLDTPARIYYKYEGVSPAGSHKPNTAVAQAYYNRKERVARIATETGAGQWGSAPAMACNFLGLQCKVYMVKVSYQQKPYRSEEHTSELQSRLHLVCRLLLEKKKNNCSHTNLDGQNDDIDGKRCMIGEVSA